MAIAIFINDAKKNRNETHAGIGVNFLNCMNKVIITENRTTLKFKNSRLIETLEINLKHPRSAFLGNFNFNKLLVTYFLILHLVTTL